MVETLRDTVIIFILVEGILIIFAIAVLVVQIAADSDAYGAGLRAGDVVVAFNGQNVSDPSQLFRLVSDAEIGSNGTLRILREGRNIDIPVPIVGPSRPR